MTFNSIPECSVKFSDDTLSCSSDILAIPITSLTQEFHYALNLLFGSIPVIFPVLVVGFSVSLLLSFIRSSKS